MIKNNIVTLYRCLIKDGLRKSAHLLAMLYLTAGYDDEWRENISMLAKSNPYPFSSWFPGGQDRVYIDFVRHNIDIPEQVTDALSLLNMEIEDYIKGYGKDFSGRQIKIGKALNNKIVNLTKQLADLPEESIEERKDMTEQIAVLKNALSVFNNDLNRSNSKSNDYQIVISQNPHDVATSAFERNWDSCFNIGKNPHDSERGSNAETIFCEVRDGGMIAYIINSDDKDIKNPHARIMIRRFTNQDGKSIALAEEKIYGNNIPGFKDVVNKWLADKNGNLPYGIYNRIGGEYSDTFSDVEYVTPKEESEMIGWLKEKVGIEPITIKFSVRDKDYFMLKSNDWWEKYDDPFDDSIYFMNNESDWFDEYYEPNKSYNNIKIFDNEADAQRFIEKVKNIGDPDEYMKIKLIHSDGYDIDDIDLIPKEEYWQKYEEFMNNRFLIHKKYTDHSKKLKKEVIKNIIEEERDYSPELLDLAKKFIFSAPSNLIFTKFFSIYPNILSGDEFKTLDPHTVSLVLYSKRLSDDKLKEFNEAGKEILRNHLDFDKIMKSITEMHKIRSDDDDYNSSNICYNINIAINNACMYLKELDSKDKKFMNEFSRKIDSIPKLNKADANRLKITILHNFYIKSNPTPDEIYPIIKTLMGSYKNDVLLMDDGTSINLHTIGTYITILGSNYKYAKEFLPIFIYQKNNLRQILEKEVEKNRFHNAYSEKAEKDVVDYHFEFINRKLYYVIDCLENGTGKSEAFFW